MVQRKELNIGDQDPFCRGGLGNDGPQLAEVPQMQASQAFDIAFGDGENVVREQTIGVRAELVQGCLGPELLVAHAQGAVASGVERLAARQLPSPAVPADLPAGFERREAIGLDLRWQPDAPGNPARLMSTQALVGLEFDDAQHGLCPGQGIGSAALRLQPGPGRPHAG